MWRRFPTIYPTDSECEICGEDVLYEFGYGVFKNAGSCYLLATSTRNWESDGITFDPA